MRCGKGHDHANLDEVKACYGLPADLQVRKENLVPEGPKPVDPVKAREIAQAKAVDALNRQKAAAGEKHGFTAHCPQCVAGTHKWQGVQDVFQTEGLSDTAIPLPPEPSDSPRYQSPTEPQLRYIRSLLTQNDLMITKSAADALTKRSASDLIGALKNWKSGGNMPYGVQYDPAKRSADGDPEGYGNPPPAQRNATDRTPFPDVPQGHYAIKSLTGNNDLDFFRVDRPDEGQWKGKTYIKRVIGGHPDKNIRIGQYRPVLEAIVEAGIDASAVLYGQTIGRCSRCNRHLTDEESRMYGKGPDCRAMS